MWRSGMTMWREHPVLGLGPGGVKRDYERYALPEAVKKRTGHVHNTPLQILVERGVLGLAAWLWIWVAFFANGAVCCGGCPRMPRASARSCSAGWRRSRGFSLRACRSTTSATPRWSWWHGP